MNVTASITLHEGDKFRMTPEEAAQALVEALGGDFSKDTCSFQLLTDPTLYGGTPDSTEPPPVVNPLEVDLSPETPS